jgi:hypothetical protein
LNADTVVTGVILRGSGDSPLEVKTPSEVDASKGGSISDGVGDTPLAADTGGMLASGAGDTPSEADMAPHWIRKILPW